MFQWHIPSQSRSSGRDTFYRHHYTRLWIWIGSYVIFVICLVKKSNFHFNRRLSSERPGLLCADIHQVCYVHTSREMHPALTAHTREKNENTKVWYISSMEQLPQVPSQLFFCSSSAPRLIILLHESEKPEVAPRWLADPVSRVFLPA